MWGLICLRWTLQAPTVPFSIRMHFVMPPMPAHASMWPKFALALVMMIGSSPRSFMTSLSAPTSMGSPSAVPVPWHSATEIWLAVSPASIIELLMHACCDGPFGAVMLALRPSWLTLLPMMHASISCASSSLRLLCRNAPPQPSPRKKPLADSSKVKERPPVDNICAWQYAMNVLRPSSRQRPMTIALSMLASAEAVSWPLSLTTMERCAWPRATSDEEQAVSTERQGPFMSIRCDSRLARMPIAHPL
mmetsp:Transcript_28691/g.72616  ORF Transcript_28691/g.72616 Transcript_28691/m.72616 type:complete len:248 (+) Transcript_28691:1018-1761(+)